MKLGQILSTLNRKSKNAAYLWVVDRGKRLGSGSQRTAYRIGDYVVKANTCAWELNEWDEDLKAKMMRVPRKALKDAGLVPVPTWYAGRKRQWVVQRYYGPALAHVLHGDDQFRSALGLGWLDYPNVVWEVAPGVTIGLDIAPRNCSVRESDGALVAFDW